jgi:hypothetical protein
MMKKYALVFLLFLLASPAFAQPPAWNKLIHANHIDCSFPLGSIANWEHGDVTVDKGRFKVMLQFEAINLKKRTATVITKDYSADVSLFLTPSGLFFVETTGVGNVIMTAVFPRYQKGTRHFIAVTSNHIYLPDSTPLSSQHHGTCKIVE